MIASLVIALLTSAAPALEDDFARLVKDAEAASAKGALDEAVALAKQASSVARDDPSRALRAYVLAGDLELKRKRPVHAARMYRDAAHLAIEDLGARSRAMAKRKAAVAASKSARRKEHVTKLLAADALVGEAERSPRRPKLGADLRAKLADAIQLYEKDGDHAFARRAAAVRALVAVRSGAVEEGAKEARALAAKTEPHAVRLVALDALLAASARDFDAATGVMLELHAARIERLPEAQRLYHRTRELDQACVKYDAAHGFGACARLERELTGRFTLTDRSRDRPKRELSAADLEPIHRQLLPAIEDCVKTAAHGNEDMFRSTDLRISWAILPKGTAIDEEIAPKRYVEILGPCVRERLGWARYPRFTSEERKTVTVPYHLD